MNPDSKTAHKVNTTTAAALSAAGMSPALSAVAGEMAASIHRLAEGPLILTWRMGQQINAVMADPAKYGSTAIEQLADRLKISESSLYSYRSFARCYSLEQLRTVAKRRNGNGEPISIGHLNLLLAAGPKDRDRLLERTFEESLSVRALGSVIAAEGKRANPNKLGRRPRQPQSPVLAAQEIIKVSHSYLARGDNWARSLEKVLQMSPDGVDKILCIKLKDAQDSVTKMCEKLGQCNELLKKSIARAERVLRHRKQAQVTAPATSDEAEGNDVETEAVATPLPAADDAE